MRTMLRSSIVVLACVAVIALSYRQCGGARPFYYYSPDGYVQRANALIDAGKIDFDCEQNRIVVRIPEGTAEYRWYQTSYLQTDVEAFNDAQQRFADRFLLEGCELRGVNPFTHVVRLPRTDDRDYEWHGELRYASTRAAGTLLGEGQMVGLLHPARPVTGQDVRPIPVNRPAGQAGTVFHEATVANFFFPPHPSTEAAEVYVVGDTAVLKDRRDEAIWNTHPVFVMGRGLTRGRITALENGDWIQFVDAAARPERRYTYLYTPRDVARLISTAERRHNGWLRSNRPNSLGFVSDFVSGMNDIVRKTESPHVADLSVELTLDRLLQETLTTKLRAAIKPRAQRMNRPVRGAITMMDAASGDLLALASYPTSSQDLDRFADLSTGQQRRLLSNQNFFKHPIGSAGKPYWAAAIVNEYPFLASFSVPPHGENPLYPTAAGHPLDQGYEVHSHLGGRVGMERFLSESSNKYLIDLATVALGIKPECAGRSTVTRLSDCLVSHADELEELDRFAFSQVSGTHLPTLGRHDRSAGDPWALDRNNIFVQMQNLTGAQVYSESAAEFAATSPDVVNALFDRWYKTARSHPYPWRQAVRWIGTQTTEPATASLVHARFAAVSPEGVNLAVNTVNRLRSEWVNLLLGGGTSLWNNVQLAEAQSRLTMGRDVRANLVGRLYAGPRAMSESASNGRPAAARSEEHLLPDGGLREDARRVVLLGMQAVLTAPAGTAHRLHTPKFNLEAELAREFPEHDVWLFGKTGTPRVQVQTVLPRIRVLRELFYSRGLAYDPVRKEVSLTTAGSQALARQSRAAAESVRRYIADMNGDLAEFQTTAPGAARLPLLLNGERLELNEQVQGGRAMISSKGALFVLTALLTPKAGAPPARGPAPDSLPPGTAGRLQAIPRAADLQRADTAAVTTVIYLDDVSGTSSEAVDLVEPIRDELVQALRSRLGDSNTTNRPKL
jgi:cell division protein FtsI/penicillin-binding protein 2